MNTVIDDQARPAAPPDLEAAELPETVIEARRGWQAVDLKELWRHRDLFWFQSWRNVKGRYAQSALGLGWVVVQPLLTLLTFTLIFGRVIRIPTPGGTPYILFVFCGMVPWNYFSGAMNAAATSLISEAYVLSKVYFPRLILPLTQVVARLVDLFATLGLLLLLGVFYGVVPRPESLVILPLALLIASACALGVGLWLASLAIQYRDVAHIIGFLAQIWMYLSPVVYSASRIPDRYQWLYGLNPMVGVIEAFRSCMLGIPAMPWGALAEGAAVSAVLLVTGALYFRRCEQFFADVV
jgi:lipopolysaccharide transport system permease protein